MAVVRASTAGTASLDVLVLRVENPAVGDWTADPVDGTGMLAVLREVDEHDEATGRIAGVEIVDFLHFDRWDALPKLDVLWELPGQEPLLLDELLKREQRRLRQQAKVVA
ncbi:MAG: hypothetical protein HY691_15880 [Chloroflexi bacterium]|nr:hypothetical protein [Chloroflexota bacterium]